MPGERPDRRRCPYRDDLAAAHLRGVVDAPRYVDGVAHVVAAGRAPLRAAPDPARPLDSEMLFGEGFTVYDAATADGWVWGQGAADGYVGWLPAAALRRCAPALPTHIVTARHSFLFPAPDIKAPALDALPMGAALHAVGESGRFLELADGAGFVFAGHAAPWGWRVADPLDVAESLLGVPYLWGGRTPLGIDCSGLVQLCLACAGVAAPRDSDMQRAELGAAAATPPRRGDVVCFPGHVAFMWDEQRVIHATAFTLSVCIEPLADVALRADPTRGRGVSAVRRIKPSATAP